MLLHKISSLLHLNFCKIPTTGSYVCQKKSLEKLKFSVYSKNLTNYGVIAKSIGDYVSTVDSGSSSCFSEYELWQIADHPMSSVTVLFVIKNQKNLFIAFEDVGDIIRISRHTGAHLVLSHLCQFSNRSELLNRISPLDLVKISSQKGSHKVLELFMDPRSWTTLVDRLGKDLVIKVASLAGSRQVFQICLKNFLWSTLVNRIGIDDLRRLTSFKGAAKVLDLFLRSGVWEILSKRVGPSFLLKLSCQPHSFSLLNYILNSKICDVLKDRVDDHEVFKIFSSSFSKDVLDLVQDEMIWSKLESRIGKKCLLNLLSSQGSFKILKTILDDRCWFDLSSRLGNYLSFFQNSSFAVDFFSYAMQPEPWQKLLDRVGLDVLGSISNLNYIGNILESILDDRDWQILSQNFPSDFIKEVCKSSVGAKLLMFLLKKENMPILSRCRDLSDAKFVQVIDVLKLFLDPKKMKIIKSCLDDGMIADLLIRYESKLLFEKVLDQSKWTYLVSHLNQKNVLKLFFHSDANNILGLLLVESNLKVLARLVGSEKIVDLALNVSNVLILDYLIHSADFLIETFSDKDIFEFSTLSIDDLKGLSAYTINRLKNVYEFDNSDILSFLILSGKNISYILFLIDSKLDLVELMFSSIEISFLFKIDQCEKVLKIEELSIFSRKRFFFICLIEFCKNLSIRFHDFEKMKSVFDRYAFHFLNINSSFLHRVSSKNHPFLEKCIFRLKESDVTADLKEPESKRRRLLDSDESGYFDSLDVSMCSILNEALSDSEWHQISNITL